MTMIAYTHSTSRITKGDRYKNLSYGGVRRGIQETIPTAHIPQTGTRETMCGRPVYEQVDVEEDANIKVCKVCQNRLRLTALKFPRSELVRSLLGNNLLPAPIM